jgi:hypothetical protein
MIGVVVETCYAGACIKLTGSWTEKSRSLATQASLQPEFASVADVEALLHCRTLWFHNLSKAGKRSRQLFC